MEKTY